MNEASFVKDYLPEPPTPISIAFPLGYLKIRAILLLIKLRIKP
jgi:hypothetical protein